MWHLRSNKSLLIFSGILGMLAVALGAFGAHGLKDILPSDKITTFSTGITYHFYHTFALLAAILLNKISPSKWFIWSGYLFILGIILFSGSLYLLATREVIGLTSYQWLGPITPIGGLFFMVGWLTLSIGAFYDNDRNAAN